VSRSGSVVMVTKATRSFMGVLFTIACALAISSA
jgi:hypothetical protein